MKRIILYTMLILPFLVSSCYDKNEVEYTGAKDLCGQWIVTDSITGTEFVITTSNTSSNSSDSLYITDVSAGVAGFWDFQVKVNANVSSMTFSQDSIINMVLMNEVVDKKDYNGDKKINAIVPYDIKMNIKIGKIVKDAVTMPSGVKSDKISFVVEFEDDAPAYTSYPIHGYRKTGFHEDDGFVLEW
jgi:hypothetical protein